VKRKLTRWFLPLLLALLGILVFVTPCLAISPPNDIGILGVWAYRNCRETGDQLYLIEYEITYNSTPSETVTEAYMVRLMDGNATLGYVYPFSYHNKGYDKGVAAIYFSSGGPPAWDEPYLMELLGNPFSDWEGALPSVLYFPFDLWQDNEVAITQVLIASRIIWLANELEIDWGKDMVTTSDVGKDVLTAYAAGYFTNVMPYLYEIAPKIFPEGSLPSTIISPDIPPEEIRTDYADSLTADIIGTPLDLTNVAAIFGVSRGALTAILYYGLVLVVLIAAARRIGSYRPVMLFGGFLVIIGSFVGVPLMVAILGALAGFVMIGFVIFYRPSSA